MAMILTSDHKEEEQSRKTVIQPGSTTSIDDLTDQLLVEILQRVPCNSAFQCKSVSKRWFTLISDPYFTHSVLRHYHSNEKLRPEFVVKFYSKELVITSQHPEVRFRLDLSFLPCSQTFQKPCIVGSSNGLLLCCTTWLYQTTYYVCNPLTKQWVVLPPAPTMQGGFRCIGFISYPSYDKSQCSFKVVRLCKFLPIEYEFMGDTFSSETGQWKDLVLSWPLGIICSDMSEIAIAYNGMLHWVMDIANKITVHDPANDKVHAIIDFPKDVHPIRNFDCSLWSFECGLWHGCIRIAQLLGLYSTECYSLKVWELTDYTTGKWQLMHKINLKELTWEENSPLPQAKSTIPCSLLAFHPHEDGIYLKFKDSLVSCNLQTKTLKFARKLPHKMGDYYVWKDVFTIVLPPWPTPVPALPHDILLQ